MFGNSKDNFAVKGGGLPLNPGVSGGMRYGLPNKEPSLLIDFDANFGVTTNNNSFVVSWRDKVRGITCQAPTKTNYPTITSIRENVKGITFDASVQFLTAKVRILELENVKELTMIMVSAGGVSSIGAALLAAGAEYGMGRFGYQVTDNADLSTGMSLWVAGNSTTITWHGTVSNTTAGPHQTTLANKTLGNQLCIYIVTFDGGQPTSTDRIKHSINGGGLIPNDSQNNLPVKSFIANGAKTEFNIGCSSDGAGLVGTKGQGTIVRIQIYNKLIPIGGHALAGIVNRLSNEYQIKSRRQVICIGDSRTHNAVHPTTAGWAEQMAQQLGTPFLVYNTGRGNNTVSDELTNQTNKYSTLVNTFPRQIFTVWLGVNDFNLNGDSAATIFSNLLTFCTNLKTFRSDCVVIIFTELPCNNTTVPTIETDRQTLNTSIRSQGSPPWDFICDIGNDATIGQAGQHTNSTYYSDGLHPTFAGDTIIANTAYAIIKDL